MQRRYCRMFCLQKNKRSLHPLRVQIERAANASPIYQHRILIGAKIISQILKEHYFIASPDPDNQRGSGSRTSNPFRSDSARRRPFYHVALTQRRGKPATDKIRMGAQIKEADSPRRPKTAIFATRPCPARYPASAPCQTYSPKKNVAESTNIASVETNPLINKGVTPSGNIRATRRGNAKPTAPRTGHRVTALRNTAAATGHIAAWSGFPDRAKSPAPSVS